MSKLLFFLVLFYFTCAAVQKKQSKKTISFFRPALYYRNFVLSIDDDFHYSDRDTLKGRRVFGYLITRYKTANNLLNIHLKVNDRDTSFSYDVSKCDSIILGLGYEYFFVLNEKQYVWAGD